MIDHLVRGTGSAQEPLGYRIFSSDFLTDTVEYERPWKERLLSLPWRPWRKVGRRIVPSDRIIFMSDGHVMAHPVVVERIRQMSMEEV